MNRDETIALFERCEAARAEAKKAALAEGKWEEAYEIAHEAAKATWNDWAEQLLTERAAMEKDGRWEKESARKEEDAQVDFTFIHFQTTSSLPTERNNPATSEESDRLAAGSTRDDEHGEPPTKRLRIEGSTVDFSGFKFPGRAWFVSAQFTGDASFADAQFTGRTTFYSAHFTGSTSFDHAQFTGDARFASAHFTGPARFYRAQFTADTSFAKARFNGLASFTSTQFTSATRFDSSQFTDDTSFASATFSGPARFVDAKFAKDTRFVGAIFIGNALFNSVAFSGNSTFREAIFRNEAIFELVQFDWQASFNSAQFYGPANFNAMRGDRAFSMAEAHFDHVPDFIQAHFEEAPRLDNVRVEGKRLTPPTADDSENPPGWWISKHRDFQHRWYCYRRVTMADRDIPARWRALKRLAIQAHDQDREHEFFARELRSERFARDWPLPLARPHFASERWKWANWLPLIFWRTESWLGFFRFWFGKFYGLTSHYGRSVFRPFLWWSAGVLVAAMFYLGEVEGMRHERQKARADGAISGHVTTAFDAWLGDGRDCYEPPKVPAGPAPTIASGQVGVIALSQELRNKTTASYEALQLALRDGFLILYGDADTAHRTYGCLYGVELYGGGTPVAIVPPQVAFWSAMHKLWSAIMIFLFGLALRNMLKMK